MYINTGYLHSSRIDFKDKSRPLIVGSSGNYRLSTHAKMPTWRPKGRLDFQIIYIASGLVHFHFGKPENETIVKAGNIVVFRPKELQKYEFYAKDKTVVFWIHFTGSDAKKLLRKYGFADNEHVFHVGTSMEYERIFKKIISELQKTQNNYEEMLQILLRYLLIAFNREMTKEHILKNEYLDNQMEQASEYFTENYNLEISIEDYASSKGMSVSWFIRSFKKYTGQTPVQYLTSIRMANAQALLETTSYSVNEIGRIVGYANPLYFSRMFRKQKGCSPSEFRTRSHEV